MKSFPSDVKRTIIYIGGVFASRQPAAVSTVLGSCVSACLFDPAAKVGGDEGDLPTRYGVHAMEMLINQVMKLGGDRRRFQAKVFGGGHVLRFRSSAITVPEKNKRFIKEFLSTENIPIVGQRLGGTNPLQVYFLTHTGQAFAKPLGVEIVEKIATDELQYLEVERSKQQSQPPTDNVTLF
jgi:chemotaxis protein CheD